MQNVKPLKAKSVVPSRRDMYNSSGKNRKETAEDDRVLEVTVVRVPQVNVSGYGLVSGGRLLYLESVGAASCSRREHHDPFSGPRSIFHIGRETILGVTSANLPNLLHAFFEAFQTTIVGSDPEWRKPFFSDCPSTTWGGVALANLYTGFDAVSESSHYFICSVLGGSGRAGPFNTSPMLYLGSLELIRKSVCESSLTAWPPSRSIGMPGGLCPFTWPERVARQLGENEDLVPVPPLMVTLRSTNKSLMPTLFPPPVAPANIPFYELMVVFRETTITRHTDVLGYSVPEDARPCHPCGLELHVSVVWEHEDHDDKPVSGTAFLGHLGSSSRGTQVDLDATETNSDDDDGAPRPPPPKHVDPVLLFDEVLSIPYRLGSSWSEIDGFDLHALMDQFSEAVDEECYPEALAIAVVAGFFLTGDFSEVDAVVLDAIGRMDRENIVPVILGETLNGLDKLKEGMCPYFKGSPLLLQIWLYEHFTLITAS
uniref:Aminotransferase-like plant mobile domain-containing protein n=1 Tax=Fagus sylvatica TaxID=28930 RepID=A0A2N9EW55_FAGSY